MNNNPQITLVEQTSLEVADVKRAEHELVDEFEVAIEDGIITVEEAKRLHRRIRKLEEEIDEAVLMSKVATVVEKINDFRRKRGPFAPLHYYLNRELKGIQDELRGAGLTSHFLFTVEPQAPAGAIAHFTIKRTPVSAEVRQAKSAGK